MKIRSRIINRGDRCESTWPPDEPSRDGGLFHWDSESQTFKEGPPPIRIQKFGEAPFIIQDTITPYRHPATGEWIDSRSRLSVTDRVTGCITTDKKLEPDPSWANEQRRKRQEDSRRALYKSVADIDNGNAPLSEETKAICAAENERVSSLLGFDAFNVAGRKDDRRGKKYRKRRK